MTPDIVQNSVIVGACIVIVVLCGWLMGAISQRNDAKRELTKLYQQEDCRQKRQACPHGSALHIRTAVPNLCLDIPTDTLVTHNNPVPPESTIPSTIRTVNWKGL